jgi:hypothetical protein
MFVIGLLGVVTLISTPLNSVLFEKLVVPYLVKKLHCMVPEGSLPCHSSPPLVPFLSQMNPFHVPILILEGTW